ncbi:MAG: hypothetical protein JETT_2511 [Candidatus Jettenia ecosi]|uniref:Uncharacterized protein n=1 Tax=Candidatus Jettenia ecosi TaxID=2494326 RepID=A0A533Q954_9BACT|nr:MAG: hypothetical protein JETT_2511 [Candidatus Jettenia ecosi]
MFEGTAIANKIHDIVLSIQYGETEGEVGKRSDLYKMSWNVFFQNPVFGGSNKIEIGGHSYFADRLAYF